MSRIKSLHDDLEEGEQKGTKQLNALEKSLYLLSVISIIQIDRQPALRILKSSIFFSLLGNIGICRNFLFMRKFTPSMGSATHECSIWHKNYEDKPLLRLFEEREHYVAPSFGKNRQSLF